MTYSEAFNDGYRYAYESIDGKSKHSNIFQRAIAMLKSTLMKVANFFKEKMPKFFKKVESMEITSSEDKQKIGLFKKLCGKLKIEEKTAKRILVKTGVVAGTLAARKYFRNNVVGTVKDPETGETKYYKEASFIARDNANKLNLDIIQVKECKKSTYTMLNILHKLFFIGEMFTPMGLVPDLGESRRTYNIDDESGMKKANTRLAKLIKRGYSKGMYNEKDIYSDDDMGVYNLFMK